jgi:hypothetical protein
MRNIILSTSLQSRISTNIKHEHLKFANTNKQDDFCSHLAQVLTFETIFRSD